MLNVPVGWVREHTRSGQIPCVILGRYRRYQRHAVLAWVQEQTVGGAALQRDRPLRSVVAAKSRSDGGG